MKEVNYVQSHQVDEIHKAGHLADHHDSIDLLVWREESERLAREILLGRHDVKPLISLYTVQPTGEHVLALIYAYQSLVPGDYSSDLFTALGSSSTLIDADGTQYRPIHIYAIPCFPTSNKPLFDQFTDSGTIPCDKATDLKTVMIVYAADSQPTAKLTLTMDDGRTTIDIASPVNDQVANLQSR